MVFLKKFFKKVWEITTWPYRRIKEEIRIRKRLKELRERDPFIYK